MRIVIVEDEPKTREGLVSLISRQTDYEIAGTADNGITGLEIIRENHPDLIITDIRMPDMDGLNMLETLKEDGVETPVVLLTGYSDFEYARRALSLQVVEYVLKPLNVDRFLSVMRVIEDRIQKRKIEKVSVDQMIWTYLLGVQKNDDQILNLLKETLKINDRTQSSIFLIRPKSLALETIQELTRSTQKQLEILCMENFCIFQIPQESGYCVMIVDTGRNRHLKTIFERRITKELCKVTPCRCSMVTMVGIDDFRTSVQTLQKLLPVAFSLSAGTIVDSGMADQMTYRALEYPDPLEQQMIRDLRSGDREKISKDGDRFRKDVIESDACPECICEYTLRFAASVLRVAEEIRGNMKQDSGISYIMNRIAESETKDELGYQFEKLIHFVTAKKDDLKPTENGLILNVLNFIRENYADDITLTDAAACCNVTPEYLSRIFSHEMDLNFTAFLQSFRVSMAKKMLETGKYKVYEVSLATGFHDQKYFTKVFKKLCGVPPAEYKKENSR